MRAALRVHCDGKTLVSIRAAEKARIDQHGVNDQRLALIVIAYLKGDTVLVDTVTGSDFPMVTVNFLVGEGLGLPDLANRSAEHEVTAWIQTVTPI